MLSWRILKWLWKNCKDTLKLTRPRGHKLKSKSGSMELILWCINVWCGDVRLLHYVGKVSSRVLIKSASMYSRSIRKFANMKVLHVVSSKNVIFHYLVCLCFLCFGISFVVKANKILRSFLDQFSVEFCFLTQSHTSNHSVRSKGLWLNTIQTNQNCL